jgi:hypothetical protein
LRHIGSAEVTDWEILKIRQIRRQIKKEIENKK